MKQANGQIDWFDEIIVDNFAGGGGASTGIELATGRPVTIAINHDPAAILMHKTNHPYTQHLQASVWDVDPVEVCAGRPVGLAWFSPDCKHFSKAKGAALVDRNIRGLAWIVLRWAGTVKPRIIILENVEEFTTWGPVRKGKPVKKKAGQTFNKWLRQLKDCGYHVEHRELVAADYGAPTTRKRFVLIARCDGKPIVWPKRTHAPADHWLVRDGKCQPWRAAAEIIDFSLPMYSIFATKEEIKAKYGVNAVRPLAENTMKRAIRGVDKHTIRSGDPFIIPTGYGERAGQAPRVHDINAPLPTIVSTGKQNLVDPILSPFLAECNHSGGGHIADVEDPVGTITQKCTKGLVEPVLSPFIAQAKFQNAAQDIKKPLSTVTAVGAHELAAANLIQYHTEQTENVRACGLCDPLPTVDGSNRHGLVASHLTEYYGNGQPINISEPMHTVTGHDREALVSAVIHPVHDGGYKGKGNKPDIPLNTVTASGGLMMAAHHIAEFKGQDIGQRMDIPLRTITAGGGEFAVVGTEIRSYEPGTDLGRWPEIRSLLNRHCGYTLADNEVLLLKINERLWYISDITMRMLTPRELYAAMGFPPDYVIEKDYTGKPYSKSQQVARCGNAVCPPMAAAVVRANMPEWAVTITTMAAFHSVVAV
jgi:DNA (cytosine-5)-methyltransferase 1